ncbi:MAG TPA: hypothetical protein VMR95_01205 [Candidatus Binatia bacterium]|nr:hypothetical protein [Candidatus Binatia bacterium]
MDKERQPRLLRTAAAHYEADFGTIEAKKGFLLTSALNVLPLQLGVAGGWFDESIEDGRKVASRITKTLDTPSADNAEVAHKTFEIEIGVTTPEGTMDDTDPNLLTVKWVEANFHMSANSLHFPEVFIINEDSPFHDTAEIEVSADSSNWDEVQFTVDRASDTYVEK